MPRKRTGVDLLRTHLRDSREHGYDVVYDKLSMSPYSPVITVHDTPKLVQAYGLKPGETITLEMVFGAQLLIGEDFLYRGEPVVLTNTLNTALLAFSGRYRLRFDGVFGDLIGVVVDFAAYPDYPRRALDIQPHGESANLPNTLFGPTSTSFLSPVIEVGDIPYAIQAYELAALDSVAVNMVSNGLSEPYLFAGVPKILTQDENVVLLTETGRYQLEYTGTLGATVIAFEMPITQEDPYTTQLGQVDWANIINTPTTLAGYGITDAATDAEVAAAIAAAIAAHLAAPDPHPQYAEQQDIDDAIAAHVGAVDPHPQYAEDVDIPSDTDELPEGATNLYFTTARARAAVVQDIIVDGVVDIAPSQNAVFDALANLDIEQEYTVIDQYGDIMCDQTYQPMMTH